MIRSQSAKTILSPGEPLGTSTERQTASALRRRLAIVFFATYAVLLLVAGNDHLRNPTFHFDDVPALFLLPEEYFSKAVSEGRWLNYVWHLRGVYTPPWLNFQFYLAGWSLFLASAATNVFRTGPLHYPLLMAVLAALGPQATLMSGWYNTLIPGVWLLAAFSVAALFMSERAGRWLLAVFVPISLQVYTSYQFLILGICLLREDRPKTLQALWHIVILFGASLVVGILLIFATNYAIVGVFGVEPATWREAVPPKDFQDLVANFAIVRSSLIEAFVATGSGSAPHATLIFLLFLASLGVLAMTQPDDAVAICMVMLAGLGFLALLGVAKGMEFPARATGFTWFMFAVASVAAARAIGSFAARMSQAAIVAITVLGLVQAGTALDHFGRASAWQAQVTDLARRIPDGTELVYIYGPGELMPRSHQPDSQLDLIFHLAIAAGIPTTDCEITPGNCRHLSPPSGADGVDNALQVDTQGRVTFLKLP